MPTLVECLALSSSLLVRQMKTNNDNIAGKVLRGLGLEDKHKVQATILTGRLVILYKVCINLTLCNIEIFIVTNSLLTQFINILGSPRDVHLPIL